jgi:hypothetical protein
MRNRVALCRTNLQAAQRHDLDADACKDLLNAVDRGGTDVIEENRLTFLFSGPQALEFAGYVEFSGGRFTMTGVNLDDPWADVYPDLLKKVWEADGRGLDPYAKWLRSAVFVSQSDVDQARLCGECPRRYGCTHPDSLHSG